MQGLDLTRKSAAPPRYHTIGGDEDQCASLMGGAHATYSPSSALALGKREGVFLKH